jgi:hypothetical protein
MRFITICAMIAAGLLAAPRAPRRALCAEAETGGTIPETRLAVSGAERPIELRGLDIACDIAGSTAATTVEMEFFNPNGRVLEGELRFPLLDGQTVTGFALSTGEGRKMTMRAAVPVDKAKGRETFESVIRRRVDPALLEVTQGGNFKLRVYPLNPGQSRVVRVTYNERLADDGGASVYRLPLSYADRAARFSLTVRAYGAKGAPRVLSGAPSGIALDFSETGDGGVFTASASTGDIRLSRSVLALSVPRGGDAVHLGLWDGRAYFLAEVSSGPAPEEGVSRACPGRLSILWDASMSGSRRDHGRELAFLDEFFSGAAEEREIEVSLQVVRDAADESKKFTIRRGDWGELRARLESMTYDGATNLGAFDTGDGADMYFLFSDGLDNYSEAPLDGAGSPLFAFISAPGAHAPRLASLAERSGGALVDLTALDAAAARSAVTKIQPRIVSFGGRGISDVLWSSRGARPSAFFVAGRLEGDASGVRDVRAVFEDSRGRRVERDLTLMFARAAEGERFSGAPFIWASMKVESLDAEYDLNRGEIRRIGREFRIATRETSLIVLDEAEDYIRYDIEPPAELKDEYDRARARMGESRQTGERNKMERVLAKWNAREEWWKRDFPKGGLLPPKDRPKALPRDGGGERRANIAAAPETMASVNQSYAAARSGTPQAMAADVMSEAAPAGKPGGDFGSAAINIALRPWTPDAPYIRRLKDARDEDMYRVYLDERPDYENSAAFFLDVSRQLAERGREELSLRVLSNLAEMNLESRVILRMLGYRLMEAGRARQAVVIFKRVLAIGEEEPQSYRDLGLAHEAAGDRQMAVDRLYDVVERNFTRSFPGIEVIALTELNAIVGAAPAKLDVSRVDQRFLSNRSLDLRVVLTWDSDNTDIDLHVIDPNGEETFYGSPISCQGGRITPDNTAGYGPEEFSLKIAKPGKYRVEVNFYGHTQQIISDATTIQLDFYTRYGTPGVRGQSVSMRLKEAKARIFVGEFDVE